MVTVKWTPERQKQLLRLVDGVKRTDEGTVCSYEWNHVVAEINETFPGCEFTLESVRSAFRRYDAHRRTDVKDMEKPEDAWTADMQELLTMLTTEAKSVCGGGGKITFKQWRKMLRHFHVASTKYNYTTRDLKDAYEYFHEEGDESVDSEESDSEEAPWTLWEENAIIKLVSAEEQKANAAGKKGLDDAAYQRVIKQLNASSKKSSCVYTREVIAEAYNLFMNEPRQRDLLSPIGSDDDKPAPDVSYGTNSVFFFDPNARHVYDRVARVEDNAVDLCDADFRAAEEKAEEKEKKIVEEMNRICEEDVAKMQLALQESSFMDTWDIMEEEERKEEENREKEEQKKEQNEDEEEEDSGEETVEYVEPEIDAVRIMEAEKIALTNLFSSPVQDEPPLTSVPRMYKRQVKIIASTFPNGSGTKEKGEDKKEAATKVAHDPTRLPPDKALKEVRALFGISKKRKRPSKQPRKVPVQIKKKKSHRARKRRRRNGRTMCVRRKDLLRLCGLAMEMLNDDEESSSYSSEF